MPIPWNFLLKSDPIQSNPRTDSTHLQQHINLGVLDSFRRIYRPTSTIKAAKKLNIRNRNKNVLAVLPVWEKNFKYLQASQKVTQKSPKL